MRNIAKLIENSGNTIESVSKKSEISLERLKEIIEGEHPSLAELRKLANVLKLNLAQFARSYSTDSTSLLFRNTMGSDFTPSQELTVEILSKQLEESLEMLSEGSELEWLNSFNFDSHNYENAERLAKNFRKVFFDDDQVSPLLNLPKLVVNKLNVILVIPKRLKIDGASAFVDGKAFVFVAPRNFAPRMLFTLAHEVGHLIAHHKMFDNFAVFDAEESLGNIRPSKIVRERFVDAFASCLLLPENGVGIALRKIREIYNISGNYFGDIELLYLANIFGVSFQVAARRCEDLGILERGGAISLYEKLRKDFGSPEKRARELNLPPRPEIEFPSVSPQLLVSAINSIKKGDLSIGRAARNLNLSISSLINAHSNYSTNH